MDKSVITTPETKKYKKEKTKKPLEKIYDPKNGIEHFKTKLEIFTTTGEPSVDLDNFLDKYENFLHGVFPKQDFHDIIDLLNQ